MGAGESGCCSNYCGEELKTKERQKSKRKTLGSSIIDIPALTIAKENAPILKIEVDSSTHFAKGTVIRIDPLGLVPLEDYKKPE